MSAKYDPTYAVLAERLCRVFGSTDAQLATTLDVNRDTIDAWKNAHPEFRAALESGKNEADAQVEQALYKRAVGTSVPELKWFMHEGHAWSEESVKHLPGETLAQIYWLNNRQPDRWKQRQTTLLEVVKPIPLSYALSDSPPHHAKLTIVGHSTIADHADPSLKVVNE